MSEGHQYKPSQSGASDLITDSSEGFEFEEGGLGHNPRLYSKYTRVLPLFTILKQGVCMRLYYYSVHSPLPSSYQSFYLREVVDDCIPFSLRHTSKQPRCVCIRPRREEFKGPFLFFLSLSLCTGNQFTWEYGSNGIAGVPLQGKCEITVTLVNYTTLLGWWRRERRESP